jgi:alkanesulfonate monooxygenase SsuD/methylene tetrahydromethanopterin reductase-like flavin-dependent oxidoreductase (luciferase family)
MEFGYFTLSDNFYIDNKRGANRFIADIIDEAIYADQLGMHSAWIGEHHFSTLGVLSCPDIVLARVAAATKNVRLAPAVTVLPLHHPIRVAEQWATLDMLSGGRVDFAAGRGYDRREYGPLGHGDLYEDNAAVFAEGLEVLKGLWAGKGPMSHHGRYFDFDDIAITPQPVQKPIPIYVACFSRPTVELAARLGLNILVAPFAIAMGFGGLRQVNDIYSEACVKAGHKPGKLMCSYFTHFADNSSAERAARKRQLRYFQECVIPALPGDPKTAPPTYRYFVSMVENLRNMKPEHLTDNSVLLGSPDHMMETIAKAEAAGVSEIILYFNVGLKPHNQVKDEMARFMEEVAPAFRGKHRKRASAA